MQPKFDFSIVIPTWNGLKMLKKNLPQVVAAAGEKVQLVIVDNGSDDGSVDWLKRSYPQAKLISLSCNYGFGPACNLGVEEADSELVVLLNNDVVPEAGFLKPIKIVFDDEKVFAVTFHEPQFSWAGGDFDGGFLNHYPGPKPKARHFSLWASGGSSVFRRIYWRELRGFDPLYHPFYWEDTDLGYRAWKRGWKIYWEPAAIVHHRHESTVSRFSSGYVSRIKQRNHLLFIWKNITDQVLFKRHLGALIKRIITHPGYLRVVLAALIKLPLVVRQRRREMVESIVSDWEVFDIFNPPSRKSEAFWASAG